MKSRSLNTALIWLLAASAAALGVGAITAHQHDSAAHGGSTLRPAVLSMTGTSAATLSGLNTLSSGSTTWIYGQANLCDGGGVLDSSGTFNNTFSVSQAVNFSSMAVHIEYVYQTTIAINGVQFWLNNSTAKMYSQVISKYCGNASQGILGTGTENTAYSVMMGGSGPATDSHTVAINRGVRGRCKIDTTSSTTVAGICDWNYIADSSDSVCPTGNPVGVRSSFSGYLSAPPTQIKFGSNTVAPVTALPNLTKPMQYGYWKICRDGWRSGT